MTAPGSIGEFLHSVLARAQGELVDTERAALADEPDGVHQQRVRVRRLRSILAAYRGVLDTRAADGVRVAYAEWGRQLGTVRDIEVRADVAADLLGRAEIDDPRVVRRLVEAERDAYASAHARLVELADGSRALARSGMLRALVDTPGIADPDAAAAKVAVAVLRRQVRRVRKAARRIDGTDDAYHSLRKAARRMRYVAEATIDAAAGLTVPGTDELARAGELIHDVLGAHRDAVLFAERVARHGARAVRSSEPGEPYQRVERLARMDAAAHLAELPEALGSLRSAASALD